MLKTPLDDHYFHWNFGQSGVKETESLNFFFSSNQTKPTALSWYDSSLTMRTTGHELVFPYKFFQGGIC